MPPMPPQRRPPQVMGLYYCMEACYATQISTEWEMSDTVFPKSRYRDTILWFSIHFVWSGLQLLIWEIV